MAIVFCAGVDHVSPATPGVRLPCFSVTRLTARAFPLHEWVRRWGQAWTLPQRPPCVACTLRAWSQRPFRWTAYQLLWCQSRGAWEVAPAEQAAGMCLPSLIGAPNARVLRDPTEVCALARGVRWPPLSTR